MATATHTPGPWAYAYTCIGHTVRQSSDAMRALLVVNGSDNPEADGRLMAAAPELLAALVSMNHMGGDERGGYCICPLNDGSAPDHKHATVCVDARAAIAKATGAAA